MDNQFLRLFNDKDESAFKIVFNLLYEALVHSSYKVTNDYATSEDAVITVFYRLLKNNLKFSTFQEVKNYLFASVRNESISQLRKIKLRRYDAVENCVDIAGDIDGCDDIDLQRLYRLINKLPKIYNRVLLFELRGYSKAEIAKMENTTPDIIYKRRWVAIDKLKTLLNKY